MKIEKNGINLEYTRFNFSAGEVSIKLSANNKAYWRDVQPAPHIITAKIRSSDDVMALLLAVNAIREMDTYKRPIVLILPYLPYGRQDRVCDIGEAFSLKVFTGLVNSLNLDEVITFDPHSSMSKGLINNLVVVSQAEIIFKNLPLLQRLISGVTLVSPDQGATKKVDLLARFMGCNYIKADKVRDPVTGKILETVVYHDDFQGADVFISDDIVDGGKTFIELAKVLKTKNAGKVILYVTHGIFSKGVEEIFNGGVDEIYTTNCFKDDYDPRVNVFNVPFVRMYQDRKI